MRKYLVYGIIGLTLFTMAASGTIVAVAFPNIMASFDTSIILAGWVMSISSLAITISMPLGGKACDALGNKFVFILCIILFTLGSFLSAIAPNIGWLIIFRLIQGIGCGGLLPTATAIVAEEFPNSRQQSIGFFSAIFPIGQIAGPNLGGWLTESFDWRSVFWILVPFGVVMLLGSIWLLRKSPVKQQDNKIDLIGAGMLSAIVSAVMIGISFMGENQGSIEWWWVALFFAVAAVLLIFFLRRQSRVENPIIDLRVLREKPFIAANIYNFIYGMGIIGVMSFIPLFAVSVMNLTTLESGVILTPRSIAMIVASLFISLNLKTWGYRKPIIIGTVLTAVTLISLALLKPGLSIFGWSMNDAWLLAFILLISGLGQGIVAPPANNACIELMPERVGTITGVRGMFRHVGGAISVSITALVVNNTGDIAEGFFLVFMGLTILTLVSLPVIYMMPSGPGEIVKSGKPVTSKG